MSHMRPKILKHPAAASDDMQELHGPTSHERAGVFKHPAKSGHGRLDIRPVKSSHAAQ